MANCPFCQSDVDEDLIVYGGTCPKCFGEIPGEEAATDPGAEVRAAQARSDNRRATFKTILPLLLAGPVVGAVVLTAVVFVLWPDPVAPVMDFDEMGEPYDMYTFQEAPPEGEQVAAKEEDAGKQPVGSGSSKSKPPSKTNPFGKAKVETTSGGVGDLVGDGANDAVADAPQGTRGASEGAADGPAGIGSLKPTGPAGGISLGGLDVTQERQGDALSNPEAIFNMIKQRMAAYMPRLKSCYEMRLKQNESLQGRWRLNYTVTKAGRTSNVSVDGVTAKDEQLEQCLAKKVSEWKFERIVTPQPVKKSVVFRPN